MRGLVNTPSPEAAYAATTLSVRPLQRRVGYPRTAAVVRRKAQLPALADRALGSRRRVLPAEERVLMGHAPARISVLADRLPVLQVANSRGLHVPRPT